MTEKVAKFMVSIFGAWAGTTIGKYFIVFVISLLPILELRGGLIASSILGLPMLESFIVCFIGNIVPIPFILWFITPLFDKLKKTKHFHKLVVKLEAKANKKKDQIENLKYLGLFLFVGIPLPGTGAWTGTLAASILDMDFKKSVIAIMGGVILAGIIMGLLSLGIFKGILA